jgi:hypothetical protein
MLMTLVKIKKSFSCEISKTRACVNVRVCRKNNLGALQP